LNDILVNVKQFEENKQVAKQLEYYKGIVRDCEKLNIDHSFLRKPTPSANIKTTIEIASGMGISAMLKKFDNKYTIEEIENCNKDGVKRLPNGEPYLIATKKITMPCTE